VQLDEKWAFVGKKEKNCDRADEADCLRGDVWDHVALDPDSRLVLEAMIGPRTDDMAELLLEGVRDRLDGRVPELVSSDEYPAYPEALLSVFGEERTPPRTGRPGRPAGSCVTPPEGMCFATVHKTRERGRVTAVEERVVFGELGEGERVSTSYLERHNATDRHRNARKGRKTYRFSKDWEVHEAMTHFTMFSYNFCWPVRTLRFRDDRGQWRQRTPAMVAGLTDRVWSLAEWLTLPGVQR
jgi:hypothetical protein